MIDQTSQFMAILTLVGEAKQANATALGLSWTFAQMGVGDANGTDPIPDRAQTKLINEQRRAPLNQVRIDPNNTNVIIAEQVIPENEGGWWIREVGLYDEDGDLVAIANCAPSFKPLLAQGSGKTQVVRMNFIVTSAANVVLKIDPSVVLATRQYVDEAIETAINMQDAKQSVLVATTAPVELAGAQTIDGVAIPYGSRVLVKNQAHAKDNGLYLTGDTWTRTVDANTSAKVSPGLLVTVERGTTNADTLWLLVTDAPITLGISSLAFRNITEGLAGLESPTFTGDPKAPTPAQFDRDKSLATTEFVGESLGSYRGVETVTTTAKDLTKAHIGYLMVLSGNGAITVTLPPASSVPAGASISFFVDHGLLSTDTLRASGADIINAGLGAFLPSIVMNNGDFLTLVSTGSSTWCAINRSVKLEQSSDFRLFKNGTGYRYLPGGMLEQWGVAASTVDSTVVTFPVAFKECVAFLSTHDHTRAGGKIITLFQAAGITLTGFTAQNVCSLAQGNTAVNAPTLSGCPWRAWGW